jgi:hypothetical protein
MAPVGTSAVFADANPWVVLITKLFLPKDTPPLQLIAPWLALTFFLQGYCGAWLLRRVTTDRIVRAAGGALFATSPVLVFRLAHDTLCAHFILLLLLDAALGAVSAENAKRAADRTLVMTAAMTTFAAGLHPTLLAMSIPLAFVAVCRNVHRSQKSVAIAAAVFIAPALVWWVLGNFGSRVNTGTVGFGFFSTNVFSLVDPMDRVRSVFLPPLPHGAGQYEGIAYLGVGVLVLLVVAIADVVRARRAPSRGGLMIGVALR